MSRQVSRGSAGVYQADEQACISGNGVNEREVKSERRDEGSDSAPGPVLTPHCTRLPTWGNVEVSL